MNRIWNKNGNAKTPPMNRTDLSRPTLRLWGAVAATALVLGLHASAQDVDAKTEPKAKAHAEVGNTATFLGVIVAPVDDTLRQHLDLPRYAGLRVVDVVDDSPAEAAGLMAHDILTRLNDQILFNPEQLTALVRSHEPADSVDISFVRKGRAEQAKAVLGKTAVGPETDWTRDTTVTRAWPSDFKHFFHDLRNFSTDSNVNIFEESHSPRAFLGVVIGEIEPALAKHLKLGETTGVIIRDVVEPSPAKTAGLESDDIILSVNDTAVKGTEQFIKLIQTLDPGETASLSLLRAGQRIARTAKLSETTPAPSGNVRSGAIFRAGPDFPTDSLPFHRVPNRPGRPWNESPIMRLRFKGDESGLPNHQEVRVEFESSINSNNGEFRRTFVIESPDHRLTVDEQKDSRHLKVTDPASGKVQFEGPIDTDEQRARIPESVRPLLNHLPASTEPRLRNRGGGVGGGAGGGAIERVEEFEIVPEAQPHIIWHRDETDAPRTESEQV